MQRVDVYCVLSSDIEVCLHCAHHLFNDDSSVWPQPLSCLYLGMIPLVASSVSPLLACSTNPCWIANLWHYLSIFLAGRIWGKYKCDSHPPNSSQHPTPCLTFHVIFIPPLLSNLLFFSFLFPSLCRLMRYLNMSANLSSFLFVSFPLLVYLCCCAFSHSAQSSKVWRTE